MINVCVPVLKRYDLLRDLLWSLTKSTVTPDAVYVVDNGRDAQRLQQALITAPVQVFVETPAEPMGVAESWNWFIRNVPDERIISNDDITFGPNTLAILLASPCDLVWSAGHGFSLFVMRDACVEKVGYFDEFISPGYGYYEDEDYLQRLDGRGTRERTASAEEVVTGAKHVHSATLKSRTHVELMEHHRRFKIAQANYIKKWHLEESFK